MAPISAGLSGVGSSSGHRLFVQLRHTFGSGFSVDVEWESDVPVLGLFGPSGSGKSSILAAMAGMDRMSQARIEVGTRVLVDSASRLSLPPRRRDMGVVLQDALLFPLLDVRRNLLYGVRESPSTSARAFALAELLGIDVLLSQYPRTLSGGERQRVALGRALMPKPSVLLCDEPFAALDAPMRERLVKLLSEVQRELGLTVVFVSHQPQEMLALADHVLVLDGGRIVEQGSADAVVRTLYGVGGRRMPNFLRGVISESIGDELALVQVSGASIAVSMPGPKKGESVRCLLAPEGVTIATARAEEASAHNQLSGRVVGLRQQEHAVCVEVDVGCRLMAEVTSSSVRRLGLALDSPVVVMFKARSVQVLARGAYP